MDDEAVLKRAQALCARNGANWDRALRSNRPVLDQAARRDYLARAWEELLLEESGDAAGGGEARPLQAM
jgi:hypothetical protein